MNRLVKLFVICGSLFFLWGTLKEVWRIVEVLNIVDGFYCGDFLARWEQKPPELKFDNCTHYRPADENILTATYAVKGEDAATVEKFLQQKFGMGALTFSENQWQLPAHQGRQQYLHSLGKYVDSRGHRFEIKMYSGYDGIKKREDWEKIPEFHVFVDRIS